MQGQVGAMSAKESSQPDPAKPMSGQMSRFETKGSSETDLLPGFRTDLLHALASAADPDRAIGQQRYMKSEMPFFGVRVPEVRKIVTDLAKARPHGDADAWEQEILALWRCAERREARYAAIELFLCRQYQGWLRTDRIGIAEEIIVSGGWWDYVDPVAARGLGQMLEASPGPTASVMRKWANSRNIWKRRAAILAQLNRGVATDRLLLTDVLMPSITSDEFFLRKATGWALRSLSRVDPEFVTGFVEQHQDSLSPLSKREALKLLKAGKVHGGKRRTGAPKQ